MSKPKKQLSTKQFNLLLGKRLTEMRLKAKLSQGEVGRRIGLDPSRMGAIFKGRLQPMYRRLCQIVTAMGYTMDDLRIEPGNGKKKN